MTPYNIQSALFRLKPHDTVIFCAAPDEYFVVEAVTETGELILTPTTLESAPNHPEGLTLEQLLAALEEFEHWEIYACHLAQWYVLDEAWGGNQLLLYQARRLMCPDCNTEFVTDHTEAEICEDCWFAEKDRLDRIAPSRNCY